jgi:general secretion pathway protein C
MQDIIKRYFWVLGALTVVACAFFAAKGVGYFIEAKYVGDTKVAPKVAVVAPAKVTTDETRSKIGKPIADRNMFCSECLPPVPVAAPVDADPSHISLTQLPLLLVATSVNTRGDLSFATILNTGTQHQGAFSVGDTIPNAGPVKEVHYRYVDFTNSATNRVERISLLGDVPIPAPAVAVADTAPPAEENKDDLQAAIDSGIKKIDDNNYEISRDLVDKVLANPMAIAKGARVVPAVKNGKADGFKLYAIRPNSVYSKLGFSNGDTLHSINGFELTSADKALEVYTKLKEANSLQVDITRRGKPVSISYTIK